MTGKEEGELGALDVHFHTGTRIVLETGYTLNLFIFGRTEVIVHHM